MSSKQIGVLFFDAFNGVDSMQKELNLSKHYTIMCVLLCITLNLEKNTKRLFKIETCNQFQSKVFGDPRIFVELVLSAP